MLTSTPWLLSSDDNIVSIPLSRLDLPVAMDMVDSKQLVTLQKYVQTERIPSRK